MTIKLFIWHDTGQYLIFNKFSYATNNTLKCSHFQVFSWLGDSMKSCGAVRKNGTVKM